MNVLLIEDDQKISEVLSKGLESEGYTVLTAFDGESGLQLFFNANPQIVILDLMLPKMNGLELIEKMREKESTLPILILSAKDSVEDRVSGLQKGADDYMVKPFSFNELLARLKGLLRRTQIHSIKTRLTYEDITLDLTTREVKRSGERIELHVKEFLLLEYFLQNINQVLTKTQILKKIWGYDFDPQTNVVDVLVCRLRNKIDRDKNKTIQTVRSVGYVLKKN